MHRRTTHIRAVEPSDLVGRMLAETRNGPRRSGGRTVLHLAHPTIGKDGPQPAYPRRVTPMDLKYVLACVALIIAIFVMLRWLAVI